MKKSSCLPGRDYSTCLRRIAKECGYAIGIVTRKDCFGGVQKLLVSKYPEHIGEKKRVKGREVENVKMAQDIQKFFGV